ncbi:hypothetical protein F7C95_01290 [Opitutia bacterium ISCC 51]|nr:hypothetical protein F7C95_01290 [Opitutae bacterium ISCC 51]QXD28645.1 hypothetical protein GA003_01285 [Opitutae bacterium ISCC 52]
MALLYLFSGGFTAELGRWEFGGPDRMKSAASYLLQLSFDALLQDVAYCRNEFHVNIHGLTTMAI